MPLMKEGIWAKKVRDNSGRTRTFPGKLCIRSTRKIIRNRGAKVVWPSHRIRRFPKCRIGDIRALFVGG